MKHADDYRTRAFPDGVPEIARYDVIRVGRDEGSTENELKLETGGVVAYNELVNVHQPEG